jgi:DNA-binding beta-propeller fold protein YncE
MRARVRVVVLALVGSWAMLALASSPAFGSKGVISTFGSPGSGDGQFANAAATAVNLASGDVYVVDQSNFRVERFDANGSFLGAFGWGVADGSSAAETCTSNCQAGLQGAGDGQFDGPQGIAVDQSDGSVYVVDANNNRVEKFDAAGNYLSQFGSTGSAENQFAGPQGIAVDPTDGSVYVADAGNNRIEKFDHAGAFVSMFGFGVADGNNAFETCTASCQAGLAVGDDSGLNFPTRVAVDSTGLVYVLDFSNGRIERYTSAGAFDEIFDPTDVNPNTFAFEIAVGPGNDHLYVAQAAPDFSEQRVFEIDPTGTLVDQHGIGDQVFGASGLALNTGSQQIYLANSFNAQVLILGDITPPDVTLDPATSITSTSASLAGTVTPNGDPAVGWHFETSTDDANWTPTATDQDAGNGNTPVPVSQNLTGLVPNTTYFVRLAATRPLNAPTYSSEIQLTTPAVVPDVVTEPASDVAPSHATLRATLNPNHSDTTYFFEYGPTTGYGQRIPAADADAGAGTDIVGPIERLDGLSPGTTYHFRIVATNQAGTVHGADQAFTTTTAPPASTLRPGIPGAGFLPDNRGWELVSPADKGGNDVTADTGRTRAAADGSAASFESLNGFGDPRGAGVSVEYMSVRNGEPGTTGWSTHAIMPMQGPTAFQWAASGFDPAYDGELSADLSRGVFRTSSPVTDDPNVAHVGNLYLRADLRTPGAGSYDLVTACPACASPLSSVFTGDVTDGLPRFAGASADFGHVIFESAQKLTPDATATGLPFSPVNLYEWDHGTVRLAGVLPDGSAAAQSEAGPGAVNLLYMPRVISSDGSRIFFTVSDGIDPNGALYERIDHSQTVQLNASERTDCADHDPCQGAPEPDPNGSAPARFWGTSADGSRAFFTSPELLTDDAHGGVNLYMYDAAAPAGHRLSSLIRAGNGVRGVIGTSDDGHYVYVLADGQPVSGQPFTGEPGIFMWHDGTLSYVGEIGDPAKVSRLDLPLSWGFPSRYVARVTPNGRQVLFTSDTGDGLTGYDHGDCGGSAGCEELYVYSADTHSLRCVSCNPTGAPGTSDAFDNVRVHVSGSATTWHVNRPVADDGQNVFFTTAEALVPADVNGKNDVYEYDVPSGTVHLISSGRDPSDSYFMDASADGSDVFFLTRARLVGWDHDVNYDLYDARVGGGVPEPAAGSPPCAGDACHGALSSTASLSAPGSSLSSGSGNVKATPRHKSRPVRCKRGTVRRKVRGKVRCVKPKKKKRSRTRKPAKRLQRRVK